ncbi:LOW QUALITY PROTEIN: D-ribitol-5-phosphate cytidylyltransferase-like [Haliotis rubra]|uniref:LOW QUALITY PROTEIN: D-ribitol-5-phosphate cytidylyltransferase-like n=1 Tax=Haliotis rubra TaxID=36100 RepID=UPI001EE538A0|nr:LOW QUALITY PROTEIN: D-ribitol-5-phosphate cytidylyltransferase-like [Haliotis rubra]
MMLQLVTDYNLHKVTVVAGSPTRHRSIYNGIKAVSGVCSAPDVVLIHDAVRYLVKKILIRDIALAAHKHGASGVTRPLISTVIASDSDGMLTESLDRSQYAASEMPQGFKYHVIKQAYEKSTDFDFDYGTECLLLAKKYAGVNACIVAGKPYLWKVTHKKDLHAAEAMLKEQFLQVAILATAGQDVLVDTLERQLCTAVRSEQVKVTSEIITQSHSEHANTFIHIHSSLPSNRSALNPATHPCGDRLLFDHCHIHVFMLEPTQVSDQHHQLSVHFKQLAIQLKGQHFMVYAVLAQTTEGCEAVSAMVKHLVIHRSTALSGQVFLV